MRSMGSPLASREVRQPALGVACGQAACLDLVGVSDLLCTLGRGGSLSEEDPCVSVFWRYCGMLALA
ncbi:hypothetical protein DFR72_104340 [Lentzea flaviverrucosa]|uniref:Uncharacterized protein n=1 Tax=Lentzea flaviverrucosa TaxID=200379 RepID=A0A1H9MAP3_9PSEU|nr:hypothetical protein DFR72_104340 [Lentzea flaviverrucosa]SER20515.1 hypothetical protein SAMN05216195_104287 [Lentzea flaviverrucosa]